MNHFEFVDPERHAAAQPARGRPRSARDPASSCSRGCGGEMQDLPRHLGQHSGGMVICQGRLDAVVPLENASMPGRVVVQWDKDDCADMGIVKVDLLGLGMMAVLQDALDAGEWRDRTRSGPEPQTPRAHVRDDSLRTPRASSLDRHVVDLAHLPPDDPAVYRMLQRGRHDRRLPGRVARADGDAAAAASRRRFYDLVVEVAIIRPGPIVGQMVHPYLNRRAGREPVTYPHPSLEPILARTLGVPLFQEQLLRMAMVAAGFTGGQAEELRRAMGFKRSEKRMKQIEVQLRDGHGAEGDHRRRGGADHHVDHVVRALRLSRIARRQLRAARLRERVSEGALPGGVLHGAPQQPADGVLSSRRRSSRTRSAAASGSHPIDVQVSDWDCTRRAGRRDPPRAVLRERAARSRSAGDRDAAAARCAIAIARPARCADRPSRRSGVRNAAATIESMLEDDADARRGSATSARTTGRRRTPQRRSRRGSRRGRDPASLRSLDDLVARTGLRRDELVTLADIGALNAFGYDRRIALWQVERAVRPAGELFDERRSRRAADRGSLEPRSLRCRDSAISIADRRAMSR